MQVFGPPSGGDAVSLDGARGIHVLKKQPEGWGSHLETRGVSGLLGALWLHPVLFRWSW